jgi:hypothetical protein
MYKLILFSPQVKNKPYEPTGKHAFILENGAFMNKRFPLEGACLIF